MSYYTVFDPSTGKILRSGTCQQRDIKLQARDDETVIQGKADDATQKIVAGKIVAKTQAEIDADKPPIVPEEDRPAPITNKQLQELLNRVKVLEDEIESLKP